MTRRYDKATIKKMLKEEHHGQKLVETYWPEAVKDPAQNGFVVADIRGGAGKSCALQVRGPYAGQYHDWAGGPDDEHGDFIKAVMAKENLSFSDALQAIGDLLGAPPMLNTVANGDDRKFSPRKSEPVKKGPKLANKDALASRRRLLLHDDAALAYLHGRGLTNETIERFHIGAEATRRMKGATFGPFLTHPIIAEDGKPRGVFAWTKIDGWTEGDGVDRLGKGGCAGGPFSTWDGKIGQKHTLIVVEGMKDQWRMSQEIARTALAATTAIMTSSHGSGIPEEWHDEDFWLRWKAVFLAHDNDQSGEKTAIKISSLARRDFLRLMPPGMGTGKTDWTDFFQGDGTAEDFRKLMTDAEPIGLPGVHAEDSAAPRKLKDTPTGDHEDRRVNVNGAFVRGYSYYPYKVRVVEVLDENGDVVDVADGDEIPKGAQKVSYRKTRIMRSDGRIMNFHEQPAPAWVPKSDRVIALDDGTEVDSAPDPDSFCTWRLKSIQSYRARKRARAATNRPLKQILADIEDCLRKAVWLPNPNDYTLITCYVAMAYVYDVFDAIPLFCFNGEKESGKSTAAKAMVAMSFNATTMGAGSEASMIRFADQGRGLLHLDDKEHVGRKSKSDNGLGDLNEILKVSYDKETARKTVTERDAGGRMQNRSLKFFGPKVVTKITGIDSVVASRMFIVPCRPMPSAIKENGGVPGMDHPRAEALRQELHCWGMSEIRHVHRIYRERFTKGTDRSSQISAPLLTIGWMSGDEDLQDRLKNAIRASKSAQSQDVSAASVLRDAIDGMIARGVRKWFSMFQVQLELSLNPDAQMTVPAYSLDDDFAALQNPVKLGHMIGSIGAKTENMLRVNLCGVKARIYELDPDYLEAALHRIEADLLLRIQPEYMADDPGRIGTAFCDHTDCAHCPYDGSCTAVVGLKQKKRPQIRRAPSPGPIAETDGGDATAPKYPN